MGTENGLGVRRGEEVTLKSVCRDRRGDTVSGVEGGFRTRSAIILCRGRRVYESFF